MLKPVVSLDQSSLKRVLGELWANIQSDGHRPDIVVGIASGGLICAELLDLPAGVTLHSCRLKRPSSDTKRKLPLTRLLRYLPYPFLDNLRRLEDWWLERQSRGRQGRPATISAQLDKDLAVIVADVVRRDAQCVLVLDDAVDSGATFKAVHDGLRARLPKDVALLSAAITQTRRQAAFCPDYKVYSNTLCRFHWSFDYSGR